ncbi:SagB/ThcOx family dehydrogenase [Candidatus Latescibacterota bacterium]
MGKTYVLHIGIFIFLILINDGISQTINTQNENIIKLPSPMHDSKTSLEQTLKNRRSIRSYKEDPLLISEIAQIMWAAQGITEKIKNPPSSWPEKLEWKGGFRTTPSAGALYPLDIYVVACTVKDLSEGVYKYIPQDHSLVRIIKGDKRDELSKLDYVRQAAAIVVIAGVYERTSIKYGDRAKRFVHIEVGHVGQNISLQSVSLGIGTVVVGAFEDKDLQKALNLPENEIPFVIMPLGRIDTTFKDWYQR